MKCRNCGEDNAPGAKFCNSCGKPMEQVEIKKDETLQPEKSSPPVNKNKLLPIIIALLTVLAALIVVLIIILTSTGNVEGKWYSPAMERVLEFRDDNEVIMYTPQGAQIGKYTYSSQSEGGTLQFFGEEYSFQAEDGSITVYGSSGDSETYVKMDDNSDIESIITMKEETAQPTEAPAVATPTAEPQVSDTNTSEPTPTATATPTNSPTATPTVTPTATPSAAPGSTPTPMIWFTINPTYIPLNTPTPFILLTLYPIIPLYTPSPNADILGTWYSKTGTDGVFVFTDDFRYSFDASGGGVLYTSGDFSYDNANDKGKLYPDFTLISKTFTYNVSTDEITIDGVKYTQTFVPQS
ncbi:MAG: hypothetical protein JXN65_07245 [Clostridia bacterium]|nr:hypothetical protein [Clostridia bacterium]